MFGPPAGRRFARLIGLSAGGTVFGLLVALATSLGGQSRTVPQFYTVVLAEGQDLQIGYGRGIWCAFAGVLFALLALYLAGRHLSGRPLPPGTADESVPVDDPAQVWSWRWPAGVNRERPHDEPLELTVSPAKPFTPGTEDRDKPNGSGRPGISG
jgi:hypothetical protein